MRVRVSHILRQPNDGADSTRALLERLPEGDDDEEEFYVRSEGQRILDDLLSDDGGD